MGSIQRFQEKGTRAGILPLVGLLEEGSVLFPKSRGYEDSVLVGNLRYRLKSPAAAVQAVTGQDVATTVKFCHQLDLKLTVRTGGHSNAAYCLNDHGIVLDLRSLNKVTVDTEGMTISVGGGALWSDVYKVLHEKSPRLVVVGGQCPSVGVGGFLLGGGMSPFSRCYGLGIDNINAIEVVKADGSLVTETASEGSEYFWGLCGGGGGNFGIATRFDLKLHYLRDPNGTVTCGTLGWWVENEANEAKYLAAMEKWNETDWPPELCGDAIWRYKRNPDTNMKELSAEITIIYNGNKASCTEVLAKILKVELEPDVDNRKEMKFYEWEVRDEAFSSRSRVYHHHSSVIMKRGAMTRTNVEKITNWMKEMKPFEPEHDKGGCHVLWDHIGKKTAERASDATAFPWREGEYALSLKTSWVQKENDKEMIQHVQRLRDDLKSSAIDGKAAYVNFIDNTLETWWEAYYSSNYERLRKLKETCDPDNFFHFDQGVIAQGQEHPPVNSLPPPTHALPPLSSSVNTDSYEDVLTHTSQSREAHLDKVNVEPSADESESTGFQTESAGLQIESISLESADKARGSASPFKRHILDL